MRATEIELLDSLTGAYSRASLKHRLQEEVDRSIRYSYPFSILLLDLDHFKSVNDAFGHRRGDDILIAFAARLQENARKSDVVFRYGGDEFILLLPSTEKIDAVRLAARLFNNLSENGYPGDPTIKLSSSMGIASFPEDADTPEGLFDAADKRHYLAKRLGRNRMVSQDAEDAPDPGYDAAPRLIGRELALEKVYQFFDNLGRRKQGTLFVGGTLGIGKTRFLEEVAKIARLHGHLVLQLSGKNSRKSRALAAMLEAEKEWDQLVSIANGETAFIRSLNQLLADKGNIGVVFTIDNLTDVDRQSLAAVERIFYSPSLPAVAIAYSDGVESALPYFTESPLAESVRLQAFDESAVLVWLRHTLKWEPPPDFVRWLHGETRGLPDLLRRGLPVLTAEGYLVRNGGWQLQEATGRGHYQNFPLALSLERKPEKVRGNLPGELGTFIGRTLELDQLSEWLRTPGPITLAGPEGIGKSRLALQLAVEHEDEFPDGAFHYHLTPRDLAGPGERRENPLAGLAAVMGVPPAGEEPVVERLLHFSAGKRMLLLVENCEDLPAAEKAECLTSLLQAAPDARLLLTATEPAGLPGERVFELAGLAIPTDPESPGARHYDAVKLFLTHAQRADPEFTLTASNLVFVIKICRLVGGLPLGIELAAAWVSMFSPEELAAQIEFNYRFMSSDRSGEILATQNIQAVFDYFWDLLSAGEQNTLARLTIFPNEFSGEAARRVADASPFFLGGLTNRIFLARSAAGLYQMHDLVRQYAAAKLAAEPQSVQEARRAFCTYYLDYLRSHTVHLRGNRQKEALRDISAALPNIQKAWEWAIQNRQDALVSDSVDALFLFYVNQGSFSEAAETFDHSVDLLQAAAPASAGPDPAFEKAYARVRLRAAIFGSLIGGIERAREVFVECLENAQAGDDQEEAALCCEYIGWANWEMGLPHRTVLEFWHKSLAIYREKNILWGVSRLLYNLSFISPVEETRTLMLEMLKISNETGDLIGQGDALLTLGEIYEKLGEREKAFDYFFRAREIFDQIGNQDGIAFHHFGRGDVFMNQGLFETALGSFETAYHLFRQNGNVNGMATSLARICRAAIALGEFQRAHQSVVESLTLEQEAGSRIGQAYTLSFHGELAMAEDDLPGARRKLEESLAIIRAAEDEWGLGRALANLARLSVLEGEFEKARTLAEEGLAVSRRMGETHFIHANLLASGYGHLYLDDSTGARERFHDALELAHRIDSPPLILESLLAYARLYVQIGLLGPADSLLRMIQDHPAATFPARRDADALITQTEDGTVPLELAAADGPAARTASEMDLMSVAQATLAWRDDA